MLPTFTSVYKIVDDCIITADVYVPPKAESHPTEYPTILAIHGGAFVLGHAGGVSVDQIEDCLERGWIVVAPEHRLCPQVDILRGPIADCRDLLKWIYDGGLDKELNARETTSGYAVDNDRVIAFGTSAGGTLALALGFGIERKVAAILDFYGAKCFSDPFWASPLPGATAPNFPPEFINQVYDEKPVAIRGGVSLEGQAKPGQPPPLTPRYAFASTHIANGTLMDVCFPSKNWEQIDPILSVDSSFPPTCIVHGLEDVTVPISLSRKLYSTLQEAEIKSAIIQIPGEPHTFVGQMKKGSKTWIRQRAGFDFLEAVIEGVKV